MSHFTLYLEVNEEQVLSGVRIPECKGPSKRLGEPLCHIS